MSLQQQKYLLFSLSPISYQICFCSFWFSLSSKSFPSMMCIVYAWIGMKYCTHIYSLISRTIFLAYSTISNVVKIYFVCLFVLLCLFFSLFLLPSQAARQWKWTFQACTKLRCLNRKKIIEFDSIAKCFKSTETRFIPNIGWKIKQNI